MDINNLKTQIDEVFKKELVSSRILLNSFRLIDESSRKAASYQDNRYTPFYYHLGKFVQPKHLVEIGFKVGLVSGCFLKSCKSVENFLTFQEKNNDYYSSRLARHNIKDVFKGKFGFYHGQVSDEEFLAEYTKEEWDLILVNQEIPYDEQRQQLDLLWENTSLGGLVVMDYIATWQPAKDAFNDFCKVKNREPITFKTRYGTGIVQK